MKFGFAWPAAFLLCSPLLFLPLAANASIFCSQAGRIRWQAGGRPFYDYYNLQDFAIESDLTLLKIGKTLKGVSTRSSGGPITFMSRDKNVSFTIKFTSGRGEGAVARLTQNGKSMPCSLY